MAAGFSYAQAARGQSSAVTSQTPSSKVTSGTASPSVGILSEATTPRSNWADDVEASVGFKTSDSQKQRQDEQQSSQTKEGPVEQVRADEKIVNGASSVSSPDLAPSVSTTTKEDYDVLSPQNGSSSESAWEIVSQASEPSWIADRKERQSGSQTRERTAKDGKKGKDTTPKVAPQPVMLQEAAPPPVNPWLRRAEEAKAKANTLPPRPSATVPVPANPALKENQRPRADSRRKANSVATIPPESLPSAADETQRTSIPQAKRTNDVRGKSSDQDTNSSGLDTSLASSSRAGPTERQSLPNLSSTPKLDNDSSSWPTPDTVHEKDRRDAVEKESEEKRDDEATPTTKRKKQEWKILPVTPSIKFETQIEPRGKPRTTPNGERGGRGGNGSRGRGGYRGTQNGPNGADRQASRTGSSPTNDDADSSADPRRRPGPTSNELVSSKPKRASSASSWRERKSEVVAGRSLSGQNATDTTAFDSIAGGISNEKGAANNQANHAPRPSEHLRTESPKKMETAESDFKDIDFLPAPIPRRNSSGTQTHGAVEATDVAARDAPPPRPLPADGRKDSRTFESSRDTTTATGPRGGRRGGRGRGGNGTRELPNGHPGNHTYPGNYATEFISPSTYGGPHSASQYQAPRGHHQFNYAAPGRGSWNHRGNPRSQSIPIENNYYQRSGQYPTGAPPQLAIPTYVPSMFDPNGVPMTAMPYPQQMDPQYVIQMVATQLDYYFSIDNLLKDMFLRKHMDSQGFVFMDIIANFNRVKQLTQDRDIIKMACLNSDVIEIRLGNDGKERLRKVDGWEQFLLPMEQREESAQNNGPEHLQRPERPPLQIPNATTQFRGSTSAGGPSMQPSRLDRRSYDSVYSMMNGVPAQYGAFGGIPEVMYSEANGEEVRGRPAKSPIHETPVSPMGQPIDAAFEEADLEPDTFPDEQIAILTVVVKMSQQQRLPYHSLSSRTFSNGSIDTRTIMSEGERSTEGVSTSKKDGTPTANGSDSKLPPLSIPRRPSPNKPRSGERTASTNSDLDVFWVKDQEVPVASLPQDLTSEPYVQLRLKALDQRNHAATGTCPYDMDVLYQFWCHFLIRNFNNRMYAEFMSLANEDARQRHNLTGMQNLLKFYDQSFRSGKTIRDRVVKDYVRLVKSEPPELQGTAFKQLRSAWRDGSIYIKNRKKVMDLVEKKFQEQLERLDA